MVTAIHICLTLVLLVGGLMMVCWISVFSFAYHHLARKHPAYYKRLGEPVGPFTFGGPSDIMSRQAKGWNNMAIWIDQGVPTGFPKDKTCRQLVIFFKFMKHRFASAMLVWGLSLIVVMVLAVQYKAL